MHLNVILFFLWCDYVLCNNWSDVTPVYWEHKFYTILHFEVLVNVLYPVNSQIIHEIRLYLFWLKKSCKLIFIIYDHSFHLYSLNCFIILYFSMLKGEILIFWWNHVPLFLKFVHIFFTLLMFINLYYIVINFY